MVPLLQALYYITDTVLQLFVFVLIASVIVSWLYAFNVINTRNAFVRGLAEFLYRVTEPVLRPVRSVIPSISGIDLSALVVLILISAVRGYILVPVFNSLIQAVS